MALHARHCCHPCSHSGWCPGLWCWLGSCAERERCVRVPQLVGFMWLPESPRHLVAVGKLDEVPARVLAPSRRCDRSLTGSAAHLLPCTGRTRDCPGPQRSRAIRCGAGRARRDQSRSAVTDSADLGCHSFCVCAPGAGAWVRLAGAATSVGHQHRDVRTTPRRAATAGSDVGLDHACPSATNLAPGTTLAPSSRWLGCTTERSPSGWPRQSPSPTSPSPS